MAKRASATAPETQGKQLRSLWDWFLPSEELFAGLKLHKNIQWKPLALVWTALCWSWSESRNPTDAFVAAEKQCRALGFAPPASYTVLLNALVRWNRRLLRLLWPVLHRRMEEVGEKYYRFLEWVLIAFDGSRSTAPRTKSAEAAFCAPNHGKGKTARYRKKKSKGMRRKRNEEKPPQAPEPQVWITLLWHMALRLPWMWRLGPSNSSERGHALEMMEEGDFPEKTLFCGDAGFVGHEFWSSILEHGHDFLVRVGGNVKLLSEYDCTLTSEGLVMCWPEAAIRARKAPLMLRLERLRIGKTKVWMLTSVLDAERLSCVDMARLYEMRWGIEVEFRGLKQTLDRGRLRCRAAERLLVELDWSILAMAVAELFALKEQLPGDPQAVDGKTEEGDPVKRSLANTIRVLRAFLGDPHALAADGKDLHTLLRRAVTDSYKRTSSKGARYRPPNPDKKPLGDPTVRTLNERERKKLDEFRERKKAA